MPDYHQHIQCTGMSRRTNVQCTAWAVEGSTKCHYHGGRNIGPVPKHGRYSHALQHFPEIREAYERMRDDPKIEELGNEAALLRALLERFLSASADNVTEPLIETAIKLADSISKVIERRHRIKNGITVSVRDFESLVVAVIAIVGDVYGRDGEKWQRFCERLSKLAPSGVAIGTAIQEQENIAAEE